MIISQSSPCSWAVLLLSALMLTGCDNRNPAPPVAPPENVQSPAPVATATPPPTPPTVPLPEGFPADKRPAFDKSPFVRQLIIQHQLESVTRTQKPIAPDHNLIKSYGNEAADYAFVAQFFKEAGASMVVFHDAYPFEQMMANVAEGFAKSGSGIKFMLSDNTVPRNQKTVEEVVAFYVKWLTEKREVFTGDGHMKIDGKPVIVLFDGPRTSPEVWEKALPLIESQAYPCLYLYNSDQPLTLKMVKDWVGLLDGFMDYTTNDNYPLLKDFLQYYPNKIFIANAIPKVQHDSMITGYDAGMLTRRFRRNLAFAIAAGPDAISVTDFAEYGHQSMIGPSYLLWDSYWRIMKEMTGPFIGRKISRSKPEVMLTHPTDLLVGDVFEAEVLGFEITEGIKTVDVDLKLVDQTGKQVYAFPKTTLDCSEMREHVFRVSTKEFPSAMAVFPVLSYTHNAEQTGPVRFRQTGLWMGNCPLDMVWSAPADRIDMKLASPWSAEILDPSKNKILQPGSNPSMATPVPVVGNGGVILVNSRSSEDLVLHRTFAPNPPLNANYWLLENRFRLQEFGPDYSFAKTWLHYSVGEGAPFRMLEIEAFKTGMVQVPFGNTTYTSEQRVASWNSLPIYVVTDPALARDVTLPIVVIDPSDTTTRDAVMNRKMDPRWPQFAERRILEVKDITVPAFRVPFFDYVFDSAGRLPVAFDSSGYGHHGWVGHPKTGAFGGSFDFEISYFFRNRWTGNWPVPRSSGGALAPRSPAFVQDPLRGGFLRFDGKEDWVLLPSRTQMPFASTIELEVSPELTGKRMVVYSGQGKTNKESDFLKMRVGFQSDGKVFVEQPRNRRRIVSDAPVASGQWLHLAVVDDARSVRLFVNQVPQTQTMPSDVSNLNRVYTFVHLGLDSRAMSSATMNWNLNQAADFFSGDLARVRITGRPLAPAEFFNPPGGRE